MGSTKKIKGRDSGFKLPQIRGHKPSGNKTIKFNKTIKQP